LASLKNIILYGKANKKEFDGAALKEYLLAKKEEIAENNKKFDGVNDNELKCYGDCLAFL